jgi:pilus assembly protein Flp/PilA
LFLEIEKSGNSGNVLLPSWGWAESNRMENITMNNMLLKLYVKFQDLKNSEEGQDLVEYALVVALIAFGATAGMTSLATGINTAFSTVSTKLGAAIS